MQELTVTSYFKSFYERNGVNISTARAGNVIGGGDWAKNRLIPDAVRALENQQVLNIRNPTFTRPWQHVFEPLAGYISFAQGLSSHNIKQSSLNFGPSKTFTVEFVINKFFEIWGSGNWQLTRETYSEEAQRLELNSQLAQKTLRWEPRLSIDETLTSIVNWHKAYISDEDMYNTSINQIVEYERLL